MRIATWNLDAKARPGSVDVMLGLDADVLLLTECPPGLVLPGYAFTPPGARMTPGQLWATVASRRPLEPVALPDSPTSTAGVVDGVTFVSTVLPWAGAEAEPWTGTTCGERTVHAVDALEPFLRAQPALVWGGDWNHTMSGPLHGSSTAGRARLEAALDDLMLQLPTRDLPRGTYEMASVDHITTRDLKATAEHVPVERRLSDHDAYVVELA